MSATTEIKNWAEMDAAAVAKIDPSTITIAANFVDAVLSFEPCDDWAVEPRLSFYWGVSKVAYAAKSPAGKFAPEMYGSSADYRNTNDTNDQGEPK